MGTSPVRFPPALAFLNDEETLLAFLATVVLALVTGIFLLYSQTSAAVEHTVVLVGPAGAGKTALFAALTQQSRPRTHPSLTPSTSSFSLPPPPPSTKLNTGLSKRTTPKTFRVVDYPGHRQLAPGLRKLLAREVKGGKRVAVVFVVDGSKAGRDKDVGVVVDSLLPLLPYAAPPTPTPLLLLSTKLDLLPSAQARSLAVPKLHTALTRELNARRAALAGEGARVTALGDEEGAEGAQEEAEEILRGFGGGVGGKWRWEDWKGVAWAGGWVGAGSSAAASTKKVVLEAKADGAVEEKPSAPSGEEPEEDGLAELKEWLWMLK